MILTQEIREAINNSGGEISFNQVFTKIIEQWESSAFWETVEKENGVESKPFFARVIYFHAHVFVEMVCFPRNGLLFVIFQLPPSILLCLC